MGNPTTENCPADTWTKVVTNQNSGYVEKILTGPDKYLWTYRETGDAAPTLLSEGRPVFLEKLKESFSGKVNIDIYIYPMNAAGQVEVSV